MKRFICVVAVAALLTMGFAAPGYAHDGIVPQDKGPFRLQKLTDTVYALFGRGGNIGVAVTSEGVVVIDDQFANLAQGILEQIKSVSDQPIRYLINTHHHGDHTGSNPFFIKLTTIVAHDNVRKHMLAQPSELAANATNQIASLEPRIAKLEKENPQSTDLATLKAQLENAKKTLQNAKSAKLSDLGAPNVTFNREIRFYLGDKEIQVFHTKRGHTDGDSVIYFPGDKVLHMGDLFFNKVIPFIDRAHGASTSEWVESIDAVAARVDPSSKVIPGHGEVTTVDELKAFKQYFADLRVAVKQAIEAGKTREQALKEVKIEKYAGYAGYADRFASNVGVVYDELKAGQ